MKQQIDASIRICACACYRVFHKRQSKDGRCPSCGFAHYGAVFVLGSLWKAIFWLIWDTFFHRPDSNPFSERNNFYERYTDNFEMDTGHCDECDKEYKLSECIRDWESESWEYSQKYEVIYCPECDNAIDNLYHNPTLKEKLVMFITKPMADRKMEGWI